MAVKKGYKKTEAGEIPNDWSAVPIGELLNFQGGSQPDKSFFRQTWKPGYIRLIQIRDYKTDHFITYIPRVLARRFCTTDDIMIGRYGPPIFQILRGIEGAYNVALIKAIAQPNVSKSFCYYFLKRDTLFHFIEKLSQRSSGQTGVDLVELRKYPIPLPPTLREQEAIAGALSDADAWIESLEQLIAKKRQIKQGAMQELLTGKRRLPGFSDKWEAKLLGDVADVKTGPFGSALHEGDYKSTGTPIITVEHLGEFGVEHVNLPLVSDSDCQRLRAYTLELGDIVFSRVGSVDRNALIRPEEVGWLFSGRLLRVRLKCKKVSSPFLSYQFHGESFISSVRNVAVGQTMACLNTQILKGILIRLPSIEEQTAIATVLSDMDTEIESLESKLAKAREVKQGMMQELLTGRIRLI